MSARPADVVWNRAAMEAGGREPRPGDAALAALLRCHNEVMSGGMWFAIRDSLSPDEIAAGVVAFRYFDLPSAASVIERARSADADGLDALEAEYASWVPTDETLIKAFEALFEGRPSEFAPVT